MARPRLSEDTRRRLLEVSAAQFLRQGYHGTGIKDLLDRVEIPKGSFYNYFPSKEALGVATIEYTARCTAAALTSAFDGAPDPLSGVRAFFESLLAHFEDNDFTGGCLLANLACELDDSETCRVAISVAYRQWRDGLAGPLAAAQAAGTVRDDVPAEELADTLIEAWEGAVIRMKVDRSAAPLRRCMRLLLDGYLRP
ncbi:TetR/AcrR family transcriptional regulator [Actinokineospora sp. NBRC 105648]|uniref:TetR/AcrR family transcriptional regulator n=1 Tax=Actinokineospora sp. NBRC 105648 TaxID=3032206 RepID=UPI00249F9D23|nr:TetR/AcrR family transcriptional regulator [Actinokineospora sp. NBRC 105648]GLZ39975.1 TetR family transcriptional regulator [Actinokineospora sp. NBRC 105648]